MAGAAVVAAPATRYLADSSIWIGAKRSRSYLSELLAERLEDDEIVTCAPVALEVLVGAADAAELEDDWEEIWSELRWVPVDGSVMDRAVELLRGLAGTTQGAHRRRPIDYLIAACAQAEQNPLRGWVHAPILWHWDQDLTAICEFAGITHEPEHERARDHGLGTEPGTGRRKPTR